MSGVINTVKETLTGSTKPLILITGASGFVAAHVLNAFLEQGYRVRGTVRSEATATKVRKTHAKYSDSLEFSIVPDIQVPGCFDESVKGVAGVIHTASPFAFSAENNERDFLLPAIQGTKNILVAIKAHAPQVKRVVVTSSFAAIIDPIGKVVSDPVSHTYSEADWNPTTYEEAVNGPGALAYCASKAFAERAAHDFVANDHPNFTVSTICPPMIYGPLDHDADLAHLNTSSADIYRFIDGSTKEVPETTFPAWADVRNVGEAHLRAYERTEPGRYLISSGYYQYSEVCEILRRNFPELQDKVPDPTGVKAVESWKVDNSKARRELGIEFISLEKSVVDTVRSMLEIQARQK